ncbi:hypothetical protein CPB84DRAFT_1750042 [Gymnopilus junonius]|uniref:Uncharacterized protein n=1 Tax=Gymnopilus junonius TaxID=109634 RepID=A0A9P5TIW4_GYMJU|nr:hypothetical protein CPB84DRAFT_1750042 [Gymnopilus junonius]
MNVERPRARVFKERTNTLVSTKSVGVVSSKPLMDVLAPPALERSAADKVTVKDEDKEPITVHHQASVEAYESRRSTRYLAAEQGLSQSFQHCQQEHSSQELQIDALRKVKSMLTNHATGSREQLSRLRKVLADRAMEPTLYQAAQRERWMEERKLVTAEELTKFLEQHISMLSSQPPRPPSPPATSAASPEANTVAFTPEANLVRFFKSTSRQRNFSRNRPRRRVTVALRPRSDKGLEIPRIHDHKHPIPLLLREPKPKQRALLFQTPEMSVVPKAQAQSVPVMASPILPTPSIQPPEPSPCPASPNAIIKPTTLAIIPESTPSLQPLTPSFAYSSNGIATIWRPSQRSAEEILADLDVVVDIPDYVSDLLSGFDSISNATPCLLPPHDAPVPIASSSNISRALSSDNLRSTHRSTMFSPNVTQSHSTPSAHLPTPPSPLHKSPSRKRISALFSLPDALSSRRGINTECDSSPRPKRFSSAVFKESQRSRRPVSVSVSFADLPSVESESDESRQPEKDGDGKILKRLRRRMSALRRN